MANRDDSYDVGYAKPPADTICESNPEIQRKAKGFQESSYDARPGVSGTCQGYGHNGARSITKLETSLVQTQQSNGFW